MTNNSLFSATDPALGYLYQVRVGLVWALRRLKSGSDFLVSLETLDDVAFEKDGEVENLLQTKHHLKSKAKLTDASSDIWKTLRIWLETFEESIVENSVLTLLTTESAPENSAASYLRAAGRDTELAENLLETAAKNSNSKTNKKACELFLGTDSKKRQMLLKSIIIIDAAPDIIDLDTELRNEIFWAVRREHHEAFSKRIEGWWFRRVLSQLSGDQNADKILGEEIEAEMADLREQFKMDSLPIDDDLLEFTLDEATQEKHASARFVKQIEITKAGNRRIAAAIRDYYRAFEQRSRWTREDLLLVGELNKYEKRLIEEWELEFAAMSDELGEDAAEEAKTKAARAILAWAERKNISIRKGVSEPFITRGSFHLLADQAHIGWHPEFIQLLEEALI